MTKNMHFLLLIPAAFNTQMESFIQGKDLSKDYHSLIQNFALIIFSAYGPVNSLHIFPV